MAHGSKLRADDRGVVLIVVALGLTAFVGVTALALDLGYLYTARTESQRVADAAALAGAGSLIDAPGDQDAARAEAIDFAAKNTVRGDPVVLQPSDVTFPADYQVTVTVHNTAARGNPMTTLFARVLGIDQVDVITDATAEAAEAGGALSACMLPIALIDWFDDVNGNGVYDEGIDVYDPNGGYFGDDPYSGLIEIKTQPNLEAGPPQCQGGDAFDVCNSQPGWYCWWREATPEDGGGGGVDTLGPRIYPGTCGDSWSELEQGDEIYAASAAGNKQSLINGQDDGIGAFVDIVDEANKIHQLEWNEMLGCPVDIGGGTTCQWEIARQIGRIRSVPVVQPGTPTDAGANVTAPIWRFAGVWVDKTSCAPHQPHKFMGDGGLWNAYIRLVNDAGLGGIAGEADNEPTTRVLRLIE